MTAHDGWGDDARDPVVENRVLRRAVSYLARGAPPARLYPLVADLAAEGIPTVVACRVLGFSPQAYYAWRANPVSDRDWSDAHLLNAVRAIHQDSPELGYRTITDELRSRGLDAGRERVRRLCAQEGILAAHGRTVAPRPDDVSGLVVPMFTPERAQQLWLTGITHARTQDGALYFCVVMDAYTEVIVGWAVGDRETTKLAVDALTMAIGRERPTGTVVHGDWGSQFRSRAFLAALRSAGLRTSIGRIARGSDADVMETLFQVLHTKTLDEKVWSTRSELRRAILAWLAEWERRHPPAAATANHRPPGAASSAINRSRAASGRGGGKLPGRG